MSFTENQNSKVLVIGIGNKYRCDDGAGLIVAKQLKQLNPKGIKIVEQNGEATNLIDSWKDTDKVIIVDATSSGITPGTINRFDVSDKPLPENLFHYSTHSFNVADTVELARVLNMLPQNLIVYGIEGKDFTNGSDLSSEVAASIKDAVSLISEEIEN